LKDVVIEVASEFDPATFSAATSNYAQCVERPGMIGIAKLTLTCEHSLEGRFVIVYLQESNVALSLCEADVFGVIGKYDGGTI